MKMKGFLWISNEFPLESFLRRFLVLVRELRRGCDVVDELHGTLNRHIAIGDATVAMELED